MTRRAKWYRETEAEIAAAKQKRQESLALVAQGASGLPEVEANFLDWQDWMDNAENLSPQRKTAFIARVLAGWESYAADRLAQQAFRLVLAYQLYDLPTMSVKDRNELMRIFGVVTPATPSGDRTVFNIGIKLG